ncbi:hypothetical protein GIB67_038505 [Kingdonia uniflora]|uniref:Uncharacterized protein n=1 Tax=Kingdonia uniflora TaxID=39325 RepID=A0A7J7NQ04_9MAGN|nr:hypothetical protein GIB67_038505 [Kingdonia uniflora]
MDQPPNFQEPGEIRIHKRLREGSFKGVIGTIDGTLISVQVPKSDQNPFRARVKGDCFQNGMAVCDFDMNSIYVQAGWEGTAYDSNVLTQTVRDPTNKFPLPPTEGFTMLPKNKKAQQEVTGDPSQDTPKQAKLLNGEMLHTYHALCKRELETTKDAGFEVSKAS